MTANQLSSDREKEWGSTVHLERGWSEGPLSIKMKIKEETALMY